jgi:hypothetical protein
MLPLSSTGRSKRSEHLKRFNNPTVRTYYHIVPALIGRLLFNRRSLVSCDFIVHIRANAFERWLEGNMGKYAGVGSGTGRVRCGGRSFRCYGRVLYC